VYTLTTRDTSSMPEKMKKKRTEVESAGNETTDVKKKRKEEMMHASKNSGPGVGRHIYTKET